MGLKPMPSSASAGPPPITACLPPPPYPMGILSEFTQHNTPVTLRIRELKMSFGGDDFVIKDAVTNKPIFEVRAQLFSFSAKKTIHRWDGKPLFEFCSTRMGFSKSYAGYPRNSLRSTYFTVQKIGWVNPKLNISFKNLAADGRQENWTLRGKWLGGTSQITTESGLVVASISRDYANMGQIFFNAQTYDVTVAPGVDVAFISALCVCFDEAYKEGHRFP